MDGFEWGGKRSVYRNQGPKGPLGISGRARLVRVHQLAQSVGAASDHVTPGSPNPSSAYSASLSPGEPRQLRSASQTSGEMCPGNRGPAIRRHKASKRCRRRASPPFAVTQSACHESRQVIGGRVPSLWRRRSGARTARGACDRRVKPRNVLQKHTTAKREQKCEHTHRKLVHASTRKARRADASRDLSRAGSCHAL